MESEDKRGFNIRKEKDIQIVKEINRIKREKSLFEIGRMQEEDNRDTKKMIILRKIQINNNETRRKLEDIRRQKRNAGGHYY